MTYEQTVALLALRSFANVVDKIDDTQWQMTMSPEFKTHSAKPSTLREIINYHAYDDAWIPDMLDGKTMSEVGEEKWKRDLLGDDPKGNYRKFAEVACIAVDKLDEPDRTVHCSFGDFSARDYLLQVISFRGLRSYDLSKALGLDTTLPGDLVEGMWKLLTPHADEWRQWGVYGPAIEVSESASLQQRLLGALGYE